MPGDFGAGRVHVPAPFSVRGVRGCILSGQARSGGRHDRSLAAFRRGVAPRFRRPSWGRAPPVSSAIAAADRRRAGCRLGADLRQGDWRRRQPDEAAASSRRPTPARRPRASGVGRLRNRWTPRLRDVPAWVYTWSGGLIEQWPCAKPVFSKVPRAVDWEGVWTKLEQAGIGAIRDESERPRCRDVLDRSGYVVEIATADRYRAHVDVGSLPRGDRRDDGRPSPLRPADASGALRRVRAEVAIQIGTGRARHPQRRAGDSARGTVVSVSVVAVKRSEACAL